MKTIVLLLCFSISTLYAQTTEEQSLYGNKIDLLVDKGAGNFDFLDSTGSLLGRKKVEKDKISYYDKSSRILKVIKLESEKQDIAVPRVSSSSGTTSSQEKVKLLLQQENTVRMGGLILQRIKNHVYYYNLNAELLRTSVKKRFSQRIVYKDLTGKVVGSKKKEENGITVYRDSSKRITGKSYRNVNGVVVYESYKNRITPQFMISDPFYLE